MEVDKNLEVNTDNIENTEDNIENTENTENTEGIEHNEQKDNKIEFKKVQCKVETWIDKFNKTLNGKNGGFIKTLMLLLITAPIMICLLYTMGKPKVERFKAEDKVPYSGIDISVKMSKDDLTLEYGINNAVIKLDNGKYIEINKETLDNILNTDLNIVNNKFTENGLEYNISEDLKIKSLDNYSDRLILVMLNKEMTGMREIIIAKDLIDGLTIEGLQSVNSDIFEENNETLVKAFTRTFENAIICYSDQLLGGELGTKTLVSRVQAIDDSLKYSTLDTEAGEHEEVTIRFDELMDLKLSKLSCLSSAPGIYFSEEDGVLRLYNYEEDIPYVFVSHLNNQLFFCNASDLLETNYVNLYVTRGFDDPESAGYRTFAITTDNNIYAFRINSEAPDELMSELLNEFGYNRDNITVKPVQEMVANEVVEKSMNEEVSSDKNTEEVENLSENTEEVEEVNE